MTGPLTPDQVDALMHPHRRMSAHEMLEAIGESVEATKAAMHVLSVICRNFDIDYQKHDIVEMRQEKSDLSRK